VIQEFPATVANGLVFETAKRRNQKLPDTSFQDHIAIQGQILPALTISLPNYQIIP